MVNLTDREKVVESAKSYAAKGFLCSESVLLAISNWLEIRSELIPKIATGFGAGIGGSSSICGAISGAIMALGLKFGRDEPKKQEKPSYWFASQFLQRFQKEFGSTMCRQLTGCDFTTDTGRKKYTEEKLWETKCRRYIEDATAIVFDLISDNP